LVDSPFIEFFEHSLIALLEECSPPGRSIVILFFHDGIDEGKCGELADSVYVFQDSLFKLDWSYFELRIVGINEFDDSTKIV
jgi:hypothetical protein